ncbi:MAG: Calx-beta domain-containing protein [Potamolinea sp.]
MAFHSYANNLVSGDTNNNPDIFINEKPAKISISDLTLTEGNNGTSNAFFTVNLSNPSSQKVTVNYTTADGTATGGSDYTALTGILSFNPGVTSQTVTVAVKGDTTFESNETFLVNLSNPSNATITKNQGLGTILNDDSLPKISISDLTLTEGNNGTSNAFFTVNLSNPSSQKVTVNYATADGTAIGGSDYTSLTGVLSFNPGVTSQTVTVAVKGDTTFESNETFLVNLSNPSNATITKNQGIATILNDDSLPKISISDLTLTEGNNGTSNAFFTVNLSNPSSQKVTVNYTTADGTATGGSDYTALTGILSFNPGVTSQTVTVAVNGDTTFESNETFLVNLSNPSNATITKNQGLGTILNDDSLPKISISDLTLTEGNNGTSNAFFTVNLSNPSSQKVTVNYTTADGTATGGSDYTALTGILSFNPGVTSQTVTVAVNGDTTFESNETFLVNLSNPSNATITKNQGLGTIINDDSLPKISISDLTLTEGNNGTSNAFFTVNLSNPSSQKVTVNYTTADGTATGGSDYTALTGILSFNPGVTSQTVTVAVKGDTTFESNETFLVNLSNPSNATITKNQGLGTIINDDTTAKNVINGTSVSETLLGTIQEDSIYGFAGNDIIVGSIGKDEIYGGPGNDELIGDVKNLVGDDSSMNDIIYGGIGSDRLHGGGGNDYLYGKAGNDQIWGDVGDDLIWGGFGNDILTGGTGFDTFVIAKGEGTDTIRDFQIGQDYIALTGGLTFASLSITQLGSQTLISDNVNNQTLTLLSGVNAVTLIANASTTFFNI